MFLCPLSLCCISLPSGLCLSPLQFVASAAVNIINDSQGHRLLVVLCLMRKRSGSDLRIHIHWLENPSRPPHLPLPPPLFPDCVLLRVHSEETCGSLYGARGSPTCSVGDILSETADQASIELVTSVIVMVSKRVCHH